MICICRMIESGVVAKLGVSVYFVRLTFPLAIDKCFIVSYFLTDCGFVWIKIAVYYKMVVENKLLSLKNNDHCECSLLGESAD